MTSLYNCKLNSKHWTYSNKALSTAINNNYMQLFKRKTACFYPSGMPFLTLWCSLGNGSTLTPPSCGSGYCTHVWVHSLHAQFYIAGLHLICYHWSKSRSTRIPAHLMIYQECWSVLVLQAVCHVDKSSCFLADYLERRKEMMTCWPGKSTAALKNGNAVFLSNGIHRVAVE